MKLKNTLLFIVFIGIGGILNAQHLTPSVLVSTPVASFSASDTAFCMFGGRVNFTDLSINSPTQWYWSFPGAVPDTSTFQNPSNIVYSAPGEYSVKLVVKNSGGSDSLIKTNYIINDTQPTVTISDGPYICQGQSITITTGGADQYLCGSDITTISIEPYSSHTFTLAICSGSCLLDTMFTIVVDSMPRARITGNTVCHGDSTTIHVYQGYGYSFLWSTGSTADSIIGLLDSTYY